MDVSVMGLAVIIPLGWSLIFYPVLRKNQKSWHSLILIATILSFLTLILIEIIDKVNPVLSEFPAYTAGTIFGIAAIYSIFRFKSKWLETIPEEDMSFLDQEIEPKVSLRHLFQVAVLLEEQGKRLYEELAEKASNVKTRKLWQELADDETAHRRLFETTLSRWLPRPANKETLDFFIQSLKDRGLFSNLPLKDSTEEDALKYAIRQEEMTADFYSSFESAFPDAWKRLHIRWLVTAEREHAERLRSLLSAS